MNWLAHIFLSENHIEYQHGNLLADLLKGQSWEGASGHFNAGLAMHRKIDKFTDSNELVRKSKERFERKGRLKGVVIDIVYDHLLAKNWHQYAFIPLDRFVDDFNSRTAPMLAGYPAPVNIFLNRLIRSGHLKEYRYFSAVEKAFSRIDQRVSSRISNRESAVSYLPWLENNLSLIEDDFTTYMPELINFFKSSANPSRHGQWLR